MAGMVSMILSITIKTKRANSDLEAEITNQEETYYLKDQDRTYSGGTDSLSFNFNGSSFTVPYSVGDNNTTDDNDLALEYFIGDVNYGNTTINNESDKKDNTSEGSVTARLDTGIYGSTGIKQISIKMKPLNIYDGGTNYNGTGYVYVLASMASETVTANSTTKSASGVALVDGAGKAYNARFEDDGKTALSNGMVQVKWAAQYRIIFPSEILDYGYTNKLSNFKEDTATLSSTTSDNYEVFSTASQTLRISSKLDGFSEGPRILKSEVVSFYVVLASPIAATDLDSDGMVDMNKVFGTIDNNPSTGSTKNEYGSYIFVRYKEYAKNDDGTINTDDGSATKHPNVFAAFEKENTTTTTDDTESETEEAGDS